MNIEDYRSNKKYKKKLVLKKSVRGFLTRLMLTVIIVLIGLISVKSNSSIKKIITKNVYESSFNFGVAKNIYQKYFGSILPINKVIQKEQPVFSEKLTYKSDNTYKDGCVLNVSDNYMVPAIESGVIVFLGQKEEYGQTIIVEQINGVEVFYSNVEPVELKLYDYIEKGKLLGEVKGKKLYMVFSKDGKYLNYKDYI